MHRVDTIFGLGENVVPAYPEARCRYLKPTAHQTGGEPEPAEIRGWVVRRAIIANGRQGKLPAVGKTASEQGGVRR